MYIHCIHFVWLLYPGLQLHFVTILNIITTLLYSSACHTLLHLYTLALPSDTHRRYCNGFAIRYFVT